MNTLYKNLSDYLLNVVKYAAKSATPTEAHYHKLLDKAPEKGNTVSNLFTDYLKDNEKPTHADFISQSVGENGFGVNKSEIGKFEQDKAPGEWWATVSPFGQQHAINLMQRSHSNPDAFYGWSRVMPLEETAQFVKGLHEEGTTPEVVTNGSGDAKKRLAEGYGLGESAATQDEPEEEQDNADWWKGDK